MKKFVILLAALASCETMPEDRTIRFPWITDEDLKAPMTPRHITAAIINDARNYRVLRARLDEGTPSCPMVVIQGEEALCAKDGSKFMICVFPEGVQEGPEAVKETAFYCKEEQLYYYNYHGGPRKRNVWLGPFKLKRVYVRPEEE